MTQSIQVNQDRVDDFPCAYAPKLRDQGEYGFLIPENQIIPVAEEMYAGFITMADQVLAGRCDNK